MSCKLLVFLFLWEGKQVQSALRESWSNWAFVPSSALDLGIGQIHIDHFYVGQNLAFLG